MIHFYRNKQSPLADMLEERLKKLAVAYKRHLIENNTNRTGLPAGTRLPAFADGKTLAAGKKDCKQFLNKLEKDIIQWRKFQSDACYLDDDGKVC